MSVSGMAWRGNESHMRILQVFVSREYKSDGHEHQSGVTKSSSVPTWIKQERAQG